MTQPMFSAANGEQNCFAKNERKQGWGFVFGTQLMLLSCAISHRVIAALGRNFIKLRQRRRKLQAALDAARTTQPEWFSTGAGVSAKLMYCFRFPHNGVSRSSLMDCVSNRV